MNKQIHHTFLVSDEYSGKRLDLVLSQLLSGYSRSLIQKWIDEHQVTVNKNRAKPSHQVKENDVILVNTDITPAFSLDPIKIDFNILFEDEHIVIINKPPGLIAHPGAGNPTGTILNGLLYRYPENRIIPRAGIVHRLDKDTSGLMVISKSLKSYYQLIGDIKERAIKREYEAICYGTILEPGSVDEPIGRHSKHRTKMSINRQGKNATTLYEPVQIFNNFTLLKLKLITGRTHQIRVHLTHIGHPLIGDQTYGAYQKKLHITSELSQIIQSFPRQALHAKKLSLNHPITKKEIIVEAPTPLDLNSLLLAIQNEELAE